MTSREELMRDLRAAGFEESYRSTAVTLFVHPDFPGAEVRLGTVELVAERDGRDRYRAPIPSASVETTLARLRD